MGLGGCIGHGGLLHSADWWLRLRRRSVNFRDC